MKTLISVLLLFLAFIWLSTYSVAGNIFSGGAWVNVVVAITILGIIIFFVTRGAEKN